MKKTWIKVKRGLLEPKHVIRLGTRFPYYLYLLDKADWDEGQVLFYRDQDAADELGLPLSTIRKQRRQLADDKYIQVEQKHDHQIITINNWTNPREYSGEVYNEVDQGDQKGKPEKDEGSIEGSIEGDHMGNAMMVTPTSTSQITNHRSDISPHQSFIQELVKIAQVDFTNHKQVELLDDLIEEFGEKLILEIADWCASKDMTSMGAILGTVKNKGAGWNSAKKSNNKNFDGIMTMFEEEIEKAVTNGK